MDKEQNRRTSELQEIKSLLAQINCLEGQLVDRDREIYLLRDKYLNLEGNSLNKQENHLVTKITRVERDTEKERKLEEALRESQLVVGQLEVRCESLYS